MVADHQSSKHQGRINVRVNVHFGSKADILRSPDHVRSMPGGNIAQSNHARAQGPMSIARAHSARRIQTTTTQALAVF